MSKSLKDYYEILEVHFKASQEMIEKAYHILARRYHPDMHTPTKKAWAHEKFKELAEAYQILIDPVKRREYDRSGQRISSEETSDFEAYLYFRMGVEHYKEATKRGFWKVLFSRCDKNLKNAREDFLKVINEYPTCKFTEDANYYYILTLLNEDEYTEEHEKKVESEINAFLKCYPVSKWKESLHFELARFYLINRLQANKAMEKLTEFTRLYPHHELVDEAKILLEIANEASRG